MVQQGSQGLKDTVSGFFQGRLKHGAGSLAMAAAAELLGQGSHIHAGAQTESSP